MSVTAAITVLAENRTTARGIVAEHGLALWVEAGPHRILFDTGQGFAIEQNAKAMGVDLATATDIVLSHGHYDHAGGLEHVLNRVPRISLYAHPDAFCDRYSRQRGGEVVAAGASEPPDLSGRVTLHPVSQPVQITPDILLTGEVPRWTPFEDTGGAFYRDRACTRTDELPDDQAMAIATPRGTVLVLGCAHAGLVNTMDYVHHLTDGRPIHAVLGGMHLVNASDERIARSIEALCRYDVQVVCPLHCTGFKAAARIYAELPDRFLELPAGMRHVFN